MSGFIENKIEPKLHKFFKDLAKKVPWLKELDGRGERSLAASHIYFTAATTMIWVCVAYNTGIKWFNVVALANIAQVIIAEWPPEGRRIDFITRGLGWFIGAIPAVLGIIL